MKYEDVRSSDEMILYIKAKKSSLGYNLDR